MAKKKIVYVINSLKQTGPNRVLENMVSGIDKNKYDVYVISFLNTDIKKSVDTIVELGAKYISVNLNRKLDIVTVGTRKIKKIIGEINPDVVHSHGILSDIAVSRLKKVFKVTTIHSNLKEDYKYTFGKIKGYLYNFIHHYHLKKFNQVVCCSQSVYAALINDNPRHDNFTFVRNGIKQLKDISVDRKSEIREELLIKDSDIVYLYVGVLSELKNIRKLAEEFSKLMKDDEHFIILGEGECYDELKNIKNKRIHVLGFKDNPLEYMKVSDVYISASLSEGLSISIIEALDNDMLLLLSDIESHKEFFYIDKSVYLGEIFDFNNFSRKLVRIRKNINKNKVGKQFKEKYLSDIVMMEGYTKIYETK